MTYAASDPYGGYFARAFPFTVTANETRTIDEDSPVGTAVGDPVAGTPYYDGDDQTDDALSYTLTGEAATSGTFIIDSATVQIRVTQGASLDREAGISYTGQVEYKVQVQSAVIGLTIEVTDCTRLRPQTRPRWRRRKPRETAPRPCCPWTGKRRNQQPCLL